MTSSAEEFTIIDFSSIPRKVRLVPISSDWFCGNWHAQLLADSEHGGHVSPGRCTVNQAGQSCPGSAGG